MHCLVTGGSGYIGRALLPALLARDYQVSAQCYRQGPEHAAGCDPLIRFQRCDLQSGAADLPLEGIDVVFHLAAIAHQRAGAAQYQRVNVDASLALAIRARDAGVKRFVFVSSVKADMACLDPSGVPSALAGAADPYAQSKAVAEQGLHELCRDSAMRLVIVRPALVYSADAGGHLCWLRRWAALHLPAPPAGGARSMVGRDDLVRLLALLAEAESPPPRLTVTDGETYSVQRLHAALCAAMGKRPWIPSPPAMLWRIACSGFDRLRGDTPGRTWERLVGQESHLDVGLGKLGFKPALSFERSLGIGVDDD